VSARLTGSASLAGRCWPYALLIPRWGGGTRGDPSLSATLVPWQKRRRRKLGTNPASSAVRPEIKYILSIRALYRVDGKVMKLAQDARCSKPRALTPSPWASGDLFTRRPCTWVEVESRTGCW
jgi:hypothetical protein